MKNDFLPNQEKAIQRERREQLVKLISAFVDQHLDKLTADELHIVAEFEGLVKKYGD